MPGIISQVLAIAGNEEATAAFDSILNIFGPVLGAPVGGPDSENAQLVYQLFNNGVVLSSEDTGTHALIGEFARAWAQGDTAAQLGLPTTDQYAVGGEASGNSVRWIQAVASPMIQTPQPWMCTPIHLMPPCRWQHLIENPSRGV